MPWYGLSKRYKSKTRAKVAAYWESHHAISPSPRYTRVVGNKKTGYRVKHFNKWQDYK